MSDTTWAYAQDFLNSFQTSRTDFENRLELVKSDSNKPSQDDIEALTLELAKLTKSLVDATGSLPAFDQRQCEQQLKGIESSLEELRASSAPKPKFAFKRKAKNTNATPSVTPSSPTQATPSTLASGNTIAGSSNLNLGSHQDLYLTASSLLSSSPSLAPTDLTISQISFCILNLLQTPLSALHIHNVHSSILLLPENVNGSVILHELTRCIVIVGCHQFRMHNSNNVDVFLSIPSNPVIEGSSGIRFGAYPAALSPTSSLQQGQENKYTAVQDFSHIRATPSPNWRVLPQEQIYDWQLTAAEPTGEGALKECLERLLPAAA